MENEGSSQGVAVSLHSPRVSHLFFADDSLLFTRATIQSFSTVADILRVYEEASGQCINATKSTIFFSPNTPVTVQTYFIHFFLKLKDGISYITSKDLYRHKEANARSARHIVEAEINTCRCGYSFISF